MLEDKFVLIIEDEHLIAALLEDILRSIGCKNIQKVSEVDKALSAISSCRPDLVILDMNLRGKAGHPIAQKLHNENVPFIISSGYSAVEFEWQGYPRLVKPYGPDELADAIRQVFKSARAGAGPSC